jgi:3'-phosphoadenosine 5'-phosphosulfate (PAPS) 3'-phosphatase
MARSIKETPILTGKNALAFEKAMKQADNRKVPAADYQRAKSIYEQVKKNSPQFV